MGELLLALNCLKQSDTFISADAARAFQRAYQPGGYIPADRFEAARLRTCDARKSKAVIFSACYHTTLVGVLYFSTLPLGVAHDG